VPLEALVGHVETDLGGFYRDAGVEPAVGDVRQEREVRVGVGARVGGIVVVLAEQVQDDGDAVLVARSRACSMASGALSPATNRRAMGEESYVPLAAVATSLLSTRTVSGPAGDHHVTPARSGIYIPPSGAGAGMIGSLVATAFWAMLPAYVPNNAAVLAGGGPPSTAAATGAAPACSATGRRGAAPRSAP